MNILHCCTFSFGGNFEHSHKENSCITCLTCFSFFKSKVFPFLSNVNNELYSNHKDEFSTMMAAVPKLSDTVSRYASHRLCANVQFSAIENNMQSMKTDPSIIYIVLDHKKNVFQMRYREGCVDYFIKKSWVCWYLCR